MVRLFGMTVLSAGVLFAQPYTLTVRMTALRSNKGTVQATLYRTKDGYPTKPEKAMAKAQASIAAASTTVVFPNLPAGGYAVAVFHDENGNGKLDANFIGIPKEPTGASNDARGRMGPPSFDDARFTVSGDLEITIRMSK